MRIWSKCVYDWTDTGYVLNESASTFEHYIGLVDVCKESAAEKSQREQLQAAQTQAAQSYYNTLPWQQSMAQQQMDLYNKQMQSQIGYQNQALAQSKDQFNQYMALLNTSEAGQKAIQDKVTGAMSSYLTGNIGYSDEQMRALNNQAMTQIAGGYQDASSNLKAQLLAHGEGGSNPYSGTAITNMAALQSSLANQTSGMRNTNLLSSMNQALTNKFNAAGAMMGVAGQQGQNISSAISGGNAANSAFGSEASRYATPPVAQMPGAPAMLAPQKPPGFWSGLTSSFASGLGGGLSAGLTGGIGTGLSTLGSGNWGW